MKRIVQAAPLMLGLVAGCAQLNEGSVDHRWAKPLEKPAGGQTKENTGTATVPKGSVALESKFFRRVEADRRIKKTDSLAITMETIFIRGFQEQPWSPRGEFIVLSNVRELDTAASIKYGEAGESEAKVVYYTGDLRQRERSDKGQFLSQTSLPLFGPIDYKGQPVLVELHTVELDDNEADQTKSLLAAVAQLGQVAYVPSSPALGVLTKIGDSILSGAQNDKEFRYHAMLYPAELAGDGSTHSFLMDGDLVLMKRGNARYGIIGTDSLDAGPIPWERLVLSPITKRLYLAGSAAEAACGGTASVGGVYKDAEMTTPWPEYRDHTYFVLNVTKRFDPTANNQREALFQSMGDFLAAEKQAGQARPSSIKAGAEGLTQALRSIEAQGAFRADVEAALDPSEDTLVRQPALRSVLATIQADLAKKEGERTLSRDEISMFLTRLRDALGDEQKKYPFDDGTDQAELVAKLQSEFKAVFKALTDGNGG